MHCSCVRIVYMCIVYMYRRVCVYMCNSDNSLLVQDLEEQLEDCVKKNQDLQDKTDEMEFNANS